MIFYFYALNDKIEYAIHPELLMCEDFVGWTDNVQDVIVGKVRQKLERVSKETLKDKLNIPKYTPTADSYYYLEIEKLVIEPKSKYIDKINCISENLINPKFHKHAPRII